MSGVVSDTLTVRLERLLSPALITGLGEELHAGAHAILETAKASIDEGAIRGPGHLPSLPGQPPNSDTGDLVDSGHVSDLVEIGDTISTAVVFDSDHALYQELGTSKMAPRPYLMPAMQMGRPDILRGVARRYNEEMGR